MKFSLTCLLALVGSSYACGGHDDGKEWTKEELAELEEKWGFEVGDSTFVYHQLIKLLTTTALVVIQWHRVLRPPRARQVLDQPAAEV